MSISNRIYSPPAVRFDRLLRESQPSAPRKGLGARSLALNRGRRTNLSLIRSFVLHAASHEESVSGPEFSALDSIHLYLILGCY